MDIRIKRFDKTLPLPETEPNAAGFDLSCAQDMVIEAGSIALVPVSIAVEVPRGYFLLLAARSSTPLKKGLMLANGIGIVDPFYSGDKDEIKVQLYNFTPKPISITKGEQLTQGLIVKNQDVNWVEVDTFGKDGHGGYIIET
jgi:dUTP pyrophosphatase